MMFWFSYTSSCYFAGGIFSFVVPWLSLIPVMGRMMLPSYKARIWVWMPLLTIGFLSWLSYENGVEPWRPMVANVGLLAMLLGFITIYDKAQNELREVITQNGLMLLEQKDTIQSLHDALQVKVDELLQRNSNLQLYWKTLEELGKNRAFGTGSTQNALQLICTMAADALGVQRIGIWQFSPEANLLKSALLYDAEREAFVQEDDISGAEYPIYLHALLQQTTITAEDARNHPLTMEFKETYLEPKGIYSMLDSPIFMDSTLTGVLCCEQLRTIRKWQPEDILFAQALADLVSLSLRTGERRRYEHKIRLQKLALSKQNSGLENELRDLNEDLKILNNQLTEYSYINSHMMRAPLCRMMGLIQLLEQQNSDQESKEILSYMRTASEELDDITRRINQLVATGFEFDRQHLRNNDIL
jgi:signal transduction histidine kinase